MTFLLPADLKRQFVDQCKTTRSSASGVMRELILKWVTGRSGPQWRNTK